MQHIKLKFIKSFLQLDYGEGYLTLAWDDQTGIHRQLTIDSEGFCSREMPVRSGTGVQIALVSPDRVHLTFTPELAVKLELETEIEFVGRIPSDVTTDLQQLAHYLSNPESA